MTRQANDISKPCSRRPLETKFSYSKKKKKLNGNIANTGRALTVAVLRKIDEDIPGDFNLNLNSIYVNSLLQRINIRWYSNKAIIPPTFPIAFWIFFS